MKIDKHAVETDERVPAPGTKWVYYSVAAGLEVLLIEEREMKRMWERESQKYMEYANSLVKKYGV